MTSAGHTYGQFSCVYKRTNPGNSTIRTTVSCILLVINKKAVGRLLKIVLLLYYYCTTAFLGVFILATAVKPFGYSRKVFRL